jgi:hypothetical protein
MLEVRMQTESLYRVPKAEIRVPDEPGPRRFSILAIAGGLLSVGLAYLAVTIVVALTIGISPEEGRSLLETTAVMQREIGHGIGRLLLVVGVGIAFTSGGFVAARLGRPLYALHAASVGIVVASVYLGALLLVQSMGFVSFTNPFRTLPLAAVVIVALPVLGGVIARVCDRPSRR